MSTKNSFADFALTSEDPCRLLRDHGYQPLWECFAGLHDVGKNVLRTPPRDWSDAGVLRPHFGPGFVVHPGVLDQAEEFFALEQAVRAMAVSAQTWPTLKPKTREPDHFKWQWVNLPKARHATATAYTKKEKHHELSFWTMAAEVYLSRNLSPEWTEATAPYERRFHWRLHVEEAADTLAPKVRTSLLSLRSAIRHWYGERFCLMSGAQWVENILKNVHLRVLAGTSLLNLASAPTTQDRELWIWSPLQAPERADEDMSVPGLVWTSPETRQPQSVLWMVPLRRCDSDCCLLCVCDGSCSCRCCCPWGCNPPPIRWQPQHYQRQ